MDPIQEDNDNWFPLESNPEVMNEQAVQMGIDLNTASFQDLLGFEEWAFDMVGKPIYGVIFNFPIKPETELFVKAEHEKLTKDGQVVPQDIFFMKQVAKNACGTIAIIHVALNNPELIVKDSLLAKFSDQTKNSTPEEAGKLFKQANQIKELHKAAVNQGDSECCEDINRHFIGFILKGGHIYELDGQKAFPIDHGVSNQEGFLKDVSVVLQKFFERDPNEVSFSTVVLAKPVAQE